MSVGQRGSTPRQRLFSSSIRVFLPNLFPDVLSTCHSPSPLMQNQMRFPRDCPIISTNVHISRDIHSGGKPFVRFLISALSCDRSSIPSVPRSLTSGGVVVGNCACRFSLNTSELRQPESTRRRCWSDHPLSLCFRLGCGSH